MKHRRHRQMHHYPLRNLLIGMGLIIAPLLVLLVADEVKSVIRKFQSEKEAANVSATQEPLDVEDTNVPIDNMRPLLDEKEGGESSRRVYPYSVVKGGVHSVQDLRSAISRDPLVATHYSDFKLDSARVIEVREDRDLHVSYRLGEEIFWTKKKLKIAKGERLITDGTNFARTRCANMLSEVPQGKTSQHEPTPMVLDTPLDPSSGLIPSLPPVMIGSRSPDLSWGRMPLVSPPMIGSGSVDPSWEFTPALLPLVIESGSLDPADGIRYKGGAAYGAGNPAAPVPEPATMLLLGSGLVGLAGLKRKFRKS